MQKTFSMISARTSCIFTFVYSPFFVVVGHFILGPTYATSHLPCEITILPLLSNINQVKVVFIMCLSRLISLGIATHFSTTFVLRC